MARMAKNPPIGPNKTRPKPPPTRKNIRSNQKRVEAPSKRKTASGGSNIAKTINTQNGTLAAGKGADIFFLDSIFVSFPWIFGLTFFSETDVLSRTPDLENDTSF